MNKSDALEIGLLMNNIAMIVPDDAYKKIKPMMDEITQIILRNMEGEKQDD